MTVWTLPLQVHGKEEVVPGGVLWAFGRVDKMSAPRAVFRGGHSYHVPAGRFL